MVLKLILLLLLSTSVYAQTTRTLYTLGNNVGVGTTVPAGTLAVSGTSTDEGINVNATDSAGNGIDSNAKLVLHADGTDASTTFIDSSSFAKTVTAFGNAQIDTAQSKFGGASALFDGTGDYLSSADSSDWSFGSSDFTLDFWARFNAISGSNTCFIYQGTSSPNFWEAGFNSTTLYFKVGTTTVSVSWSPSTATWYHIAIVRDGSNIKFFVDGTQQGASQAWSTTVADYAGSLLIGSGNALIELNGWLDEIRISNGIARWTTTFTPPTGEYTAGSNSSPRIKFSQSNVTRYTIGVDGADSNAFKISTTDITTNERFIINSTGNVGIGTDTMNSNAKLVVMNGNVGLGTMTPGQVLDINGRARLVGIGTTVPQAICMKADGTLGYYTTTTFAGVCN